MRDPKRIKKFLKLLEQVWLKYPDLRFGQLLLNVAQDPVLYYMEEDELEKKIRQLYNKKEEVKKC